MKSLKWEEEKEKREKGSLEKHTGLSKLFKEDRFAFERERKRMIDEIIKARQENLWVNSGSGSSPIVRNSAILRTS